MVGVSAATIVHFGNGSEKSQGTALMLFPTGAINVTLADRILQEANIYLLTSSNEVEHCVIYCNNLSDRLNHLETGPFAQSLRDIKHVRITESLYQVLLHNVRI